MKVRINALLFVITLALFSCNMADLNRVTPVSDGDGKDGQWVFIKIKTELRRDTPEYYYYGRINNRIIEKITAGEELKGLFVISDLRFINDSDKLELFEDNAVVGTKIFRAKDIVEIELQKVDPVYSYKPADLAPNALRLLKKHK